MSTPTKITRGCLCKAVRYEVNLPEDHDFKASLHLDLPIRPAAPLANYQVIKDNMRWFCTSCGSYLAWEGNGIKGTRWKFSVAHGVRG
ncbi:hypothetical protein VC83_06474 [Pseudogymnoascus destructans]|uniref:CENP-V/GFA domain-containing protein n=1 Tax=Pseudogymnoascus destructans TaxID=655981 RepID=A0A177A8X7_9PEZI|nr:uncharacterized protein VC83_06474 [Pseudogymnoascus destructans]OAF58180.1 hypothetical protein VC83_06474 [Pseudogymnoascus destructans]